MGKFYLPPIFGYDQFEVTSSLRKAIKHRDVDSAIYWVQVLIESDHIDPNSTSRSGLKKAARNLWIMAAEDIDEPMIVLRAFAVLMTAGMVRESDHLLYLVQAMCTAPHNLPGEAKPIEVQVVELAAAMCKARMWWETEEGRHIETLRLRSIDELNGPPEGRRPVPEYALDQHTRRGKAGAKAGKFGPPGQLRDETSGTDVGRQKTIFQFLATGKIDPSYRLFDDNPEFRAMVEAQGILWGARKGPTPPKADEPPAVQEDLFGAEAAPVCCGQPWVAEIASCPRCGLPAHVHPAREDISLPCDEDPED
jgi:hypothetical protein